MRSTFTFYHRNIKKAYKYIQCNPNTIHIKEVNNKDLGASNSTISDNFNIG